MSFLARNKALHLVAASLSAVAALSLAIPANAALTWYGPPPPPNQSTPGGFNCILTSATVRPGGGTIGPLGDGALKITITIPPSTFPIPVQVTITEPYSGSGACQGVPVANLAGFRIVGGIGVEVTQANGLHGQFPHRVRLQIGALDAAGFRFEEVGAVGANGQVTAGTGRRHEGPITLGLSTSEVLAVFVKTRTHGSQGNTTSGRRHGHAILASERLTAALLPAGSWLPGLGVVATGHNGFLLSAGHAGARAPR